MLNSESVLSTPSIRSDMQILQRCFVHGGDRSTYTNLKASWALEKLKAMQTTIILHCAGAQVQEVYDNFVFAGKASPQKVLDKLAEYCSPRSNEVIERYCFWSMTYITSLLTLFLQIWDLKQTCAILVTWKKRMLGDMIVFSVTCEAQELFLHEKTLDLVSFTEGHRHFSCT